MLEQVSNFDQDIEFIVGHAGTGKSTHLANNTNKNTIVLTPTHKAAGVLQRKGIEQVFTIHSVLKLVPHLDQNFDPRRHRIQKLKRLGGVDLSTINKIVIDEFSMIPQNILDYLLELLPSNAKVVIYGDPYQLPPVTGEAIDPLLYTDKITRLTEQHRGEALHVVETFERFVRYIETKDNRISLVLNDKIPRLKLEDALTEFKYNPAKDIILAYTNRTVISMNDRVKKMGYATGTMLANDIECKNVGTASHVFIYPTCISKGELMEGAKLEEAISKTESDIEKYRTRIDYPVTNVEINGEAYQICYDDDHYHTKLKLEEEVKKYQSLVMQNNELPDDVPLAKWCTMNRQAKYVRERAKAWQAYLIHVNLVWDYRHPFVRTIHKAQGSEYRTVYINQKDIKKAIRNGYYEQYARLMYVALSRAVENVVIVE